MCDLLVCLQGPVLARADLKCPDYQREQGSIYIEDSLRPNGYMNNLSEDCDRVEKMCEVLLAVADYLSARLDGEQFRQAHIPALGCFTRTYVTGCSSIAQLRVVFSYSCCAI